MDGWMDKKIDGWLDGQKKNMKNICMVGRIKKYIKYRWMAKKNSEKNGWLGG